MRHILAFLPAAALAVASPAAAQQVFGLVDSSRIVTFNASNPGVITSSTTITGLPTGERLTGIDIRPTDNQLYSVSASGVVYVLRQAPGAAGYTATSIGSLSTAPSGQSFGLDFNPTVDRIRFVSDTNQNLRINQTTSPPGTTVDGAITLNGSTNIDLVGSAYTNSLFGATTTTLYGLDAFTDALVRSTDANAGTYTNTNLAGTLFSPLGVSLSPTDRVGFDIFGNTNAAFFTLNDDFFSVDLNSGVATRIGALGVGGITGISIAAVPEPGTWAMMLLGFGAIGLAMRRRRVAVPVAARA